MKIELNMTQKEMIQEANWFCLGFLGFAILCLAVVIMIWAPVYMLVYKGGMHPSQDGEDYYIESHYRAKQCWKRLRIKPRRIYE